MTARPERIHSVGRVLLRLAIVLAGRMWGLGGRRALRYGDRWPF
ncbi:hypothetical protein [Pseudonocardia oceani]|nr:hypothetical protein [Pseudonocardia oceani]